MTAPDTESGEPDLVKLLPDLMARYQAADSAAAAALNPILARFYFALTGDAPLVEDLLQECWLRIHRARHSYRPGQRRWQRSAGRESHIDDVSRHLATDPRDLLDSRLQASAILDALQYLPEGQREVLMMLNVGDMSVDEVARATGSTTAAVKQKAYRAYQAIRHILGLHTKEASQ